MIRFAGLLVIFAGLGLIGISGDNDRVPNARRIGWGASLMLFGAVVALFAARIGTVTGWAQP